MQCLSRDKHIQNAATPTLLHPNFHMRNIYVSVEDPTVIMGLIDWQSTSIEPAFIYANEPPDFASLLELPMEDTFKNKNPEKKGAGNKEKEKGWKDASICYQAFDVCMKA